MATRLACCGCGCLDNGASSCAAGLLARRHRSTSHPTASAATTASSNSSKLAGAPDSTHISTVTNTVNTTNSAHRQRPRYSSSSSTFDWCGTSRPVANPFPSNTIQPAATQSAAAAVLVGNAAHGFRWLARFATRRQHASGLLAVAQSHAGCRRSCCTLGVGGNSCGQRQQQNNNDHHWFKHSIGSHGESSCQK